MKIRMVHDRVLVKKDEPETVTKGGIVIPDQAQEKVTKGTVVAVGPGKYAEKTGNFMPTTLKVGDVVLFHSYAGSELVIEKQSFYNMPESDIWVVVEPD